MKERPIIFSSPMVRAILAGTKTQTRRVANIPEYVRGSEAPQKRDGLPPKHPAPYFDAYNGGPMWCWWDEYDRSGDGVKCPFGVPGDRLWVREAWRTGSRLDEFNATEIAQKAVDAGFSPGAPLWYEDGTVMPFGDADELDFGFKGRYRHARFMPRWASRITLEITDVRVERLREISEDDAKAEGVTPEPHPNYPHLMAAGHTRAYRNLWETINGKKHPWASNPWVWALTFRMVHP